MAGLMAGLTSRHQEGDVLLSSIAFCMRVSTHALIKVQVHIALLLVLFKSAGIFCHTGLHQCPY